MMDKDFLQHIAGGYNKRKYDLDKQKTEQFLDSFFRFIFFLEFTRCSSKNKTNTRLLGFKKQLEKIISVV